MSDSVHELHVRWLNQQKTLASVHVPVPGGTLSDVMVTAKVINKCLHAHDIHSAILRLKGVSETQGRAT